MSERPVPPGTPPPADGTLARSLAARLHPVTVAIALLITTVFPAAYLAFELQALHGAAAASAQHVAGEFRMLAAENPALWRFQGEKYRHLLEREGLQHVERVRVLDEGGQPILAHEYRPEESSPWWARLATPGSAPLVFNNRRLGTVEVTMDSRPLVGPTLLVFLLSGVTGASLAVVAHVFPVRVVRRLDAEREALRAAALASERRYHDLVEGLDAVVWEATLEPATEADGGGVTRRFTFVSEQARALLGHPQGRWLETPAFWASCIHPEDRGAVGAALAGAAAEGGELTCEYRAAAADGRQVWLRDVGRVIPGPPGRPPQMRGVMVDVSDRRQAEEALRRSEESYRSLIEGATHGVCRTSPEGRFLKVNPAMVAMLGYASEDEVLALDLPTQVYRVPGARARLLEEITRDERIEGAEVDWVRKDGTPIRVRLNGRTVRDEAGDVAYHEMIAENVTDRDAIDGQRHQAQKMEAIGQLAGGVAHDFNNLLTVMGGHADLLLDAVPADSAWRRDLEAIRTTAERAGALTQQLLAFSRRQMRTPTVLDLNGVVASTHTMLRRLIGEDIDLVFAAGSGLGRVRADRAQIEQVIVNLAVNARDAMPRGGRLTLETANVDLGDEYVRRHVGSTAGPHVMLAVSDTGVGMDEATAARIFEPFFTTKEPGKGTGLGLATVYGIVKQSGGHIWVDSEVARGSTLRIYLPRVDEVAAPQEAPRAEPAPPGGTETILLIEDEDGVRSVTREMLRTLGYTVLAASRGSEALELARRHGAPIHLLLTDVVMPEMGGPEVAQRLAALRPGVRTLLISGYTGDTLAQAGDLQRGAALLRKPFTRAALARAIRERLDRA